MEDGDVVFAISLERTNFFDLGTVYKDFLGCSNALYLDGAISRMYTKKYNNKERGGNFGPIISVVEKGVE